MGSMMKDTSTETPQNAPDSCDRRYVRPWGCPGCLTVVVLVFIILYALISYVSWLGYWTPPTDRISDEGEYLQFDSALVKDRSPSQIFAIHNKMQLEVYHLETGDPAPIVLLRDANKKVQWCIGPLPTSLDSMRFDKWRRFPYEISVVGLVDGTGGVDSIWWSLTEEGKLISYYYVHDDYD